MKQWLLLAVAALLAGCLDSGSGDDTEDETTDAPSVVAPAVPDDIEQSEMVAGGADPLNFVSGNPCETPGNQCIRVPFTIGVPENASANATVGKSDMDAKLTWTIDANDFDLYLYKDGAEIGMAADSPPEVEERIRAQGGPGEYEAVIVPWGVAQDTYTLTVAFS